MIQLSGLDGLFINLEMRGLPMHISSFSVYDPATIPATIPATEGAATAISLDQIKQAFERAVLEHIPQLRSILHTVPMSMDQPYWVEDKQFNIDLHVRRIALPRPGDWETLCETLAGLQAEPLCRDKPLWEACIIENLDEIKSFPKGCFGIFLKVHHALMDGRTGLKIFTSLHSCSPEAEPIAVSLQGGSDATKSGLDDIDHFAKPSALDMLRRSSINNTKKTFGFAAMMANRIPRSLLNLRDAINKEETHTIELKEKTCFNDVISQRRVLDRIRVPIDTMQAIRKSVSDATLNDVAMTVISGGLRKYLQAVETLPEASLVATLPIDVRTREDANKGGNRLSIMNVSLASDIADPLERLQQVQLESSSSKHFSRTMGKELIADLLDTLHPGILNWGMPPLINSDLFSKLPVVANTVITNVPGAKIPLYFAGSRMVESFGLGPLIPNTSLFHTITSTCEWLSISFVSCPEAMKKPRLYKQCLMDAYQELAKQAGVGSRVLPLMLDAEPSTVSDDAKAPVEQVVNG